MSPHLFSDLEALIGSECLSPVTRAPRCSTFLHRSGHLLRCPLTSSRSLAPQFDRSEITSGSTQFCTQCVHALSTPTPRFPLPQSGKASCSALKDLPTVSKDLGWKSCELFWPDLTQAVAQGKLYPSSSTPGVLHTRPLKSGYVKVAVVTYIKGDVIVPCPNEEVHKVSEAIGQFIAWPESLVVPIEDLDRPKTDTLKKDSTKGKSLTYESVIGPLEAESEPSNLETYQWMLDEFNKKKCQKIDFLPEIFHYDHPGIEFGKEEIHSWLERKEIGMAHILLYIRFLFPF